MNNVSMFNVREMAFHCDSQYNGLVNQILEQGERKTSRGGKIAPTLDLFGPQLCFDLRDGFPLLSGKKMVFGNVYHELMWFLRGEQNIKSLKTCKKDGSTIWDEWADEDGDCGPIYGVQWRRWEVSEHNLPEGALGSGMAIYDGLNETYYLDQIKILLDQLKNSPDSRRMIVSAWNPEELHLMGLPPCHMMFQCSVSDKFLDLKMYQRSSDTALGVPYNIASYALLMEMLAKESGLTARRLIHTFGSAHIYEPHIEKIKQQVQLELRPMPKLKLDPSKTFWELVYGDSLDDFELTGYDPHPFIDYGKPEV